MGEEEDPCRRGGGSLSARTRIFVNDGGQWREFILRENVKRVVSSFCEEMAKDKVFSSYNPSRLFL